MGQEGGEQTEQQEPRQRGWRARGPCVINEGYKVRKNKRKPGEVQRGQIIKGLNPYHSSVRQPCSSSPALSKTLELALLFCHRLNVSPQHLYAES